MKKFFIPNILILLTFVSFLNAKTTFEADTIRTNEGDLVLDPFAGSNTAGSVAERLKRRWLAFEIEETYLEGSKFRFWPIISENQEIGEETIQQLSLFRA